MLCTRTAAQSGAKSSQIEPAGTAYGGQHTHGPASCIEELIIIKLVVV